MSGHTSLRFVAALAATLTLASPAVLADIDNHRTPAGEAGMDSLNRGLDSRTQQRDSLSNSLDRQRQRLDQSADSRRQRLDSNAHALDDRIEQRRRQMDTDPLD